MRALLVGPQLRPPSLVPQLHRRLRRTKPILAPSARPGVRILRDQFTDCRLLVEFAFGADVTTDPNTWDWYDVTTDVQVADGAMVQLFRGRSSEADRAQPATCALRLDNRTSAYSTDTTSVYWPNIRRNTPMRVSVDPDAGTFYTRFVGFVDSWPPGWDESRRSAWVDVTASGTLRRISQGSRPVVSALRRAILDIGSRVAAYWPAIDGRNAPAFSSAIDGHPPMSIIGAPELAASAVFDCSEPIPIMKDGAFRGLVPTYTNTNEMQVRCLINVPESGVAADWTIFTLQTTGTAARWDLLYKTGFDGMLELKAYNRNGAEILATGNFAFTMDGALRRIHLSVTEDGADVDYRLATLDVGHNSSQFIAGTVTGVSVNLACSLAVNPTRVSADVAIGQLVIEKDVTDEFTDSQQLNANTGDTGTTRFRRLCDENGPIWRTDYFSTLLGDIVVMNMGAQKVAPLLELLREAEDTDGGILYDGTTEGLTFRTLASIENQSAALVLDAAQGHISAGFRPVDDDSANANRFTATREDGISVTAEDTDGPVGTAAVGLYDRSGTYSMLRDARVADVAGWEVFVGTIEGYRFPNLDMNLARDPDIAAAWAATIIGDRLDVENLAQLFPQLADYTREFLLLGQAEAFSQHEWYVTLNLAPYEPYGRVGTLAEDSGDTSPYVLRAVTDGSELAASVTQGSSSLSVATASGPLWTRTSQEPDDFPLTVSIQGIEVTVTAISGSSSPQTFTVDPATVTRNLAGGQPVELAHPTVLGR